MSTEPSILPPIFQAVAHDDLEQVRDCVAKQPEDLSATDRRTRTPFVVALMLGRLDVAELLLELGADFDAVDHVGRTAIYFAVESRRIESVRWLLERGAAVEGATSHGCTPLLEAVDLDDLPIVELLLAAGADPDHDQVGFRALGSAISRPVAERLLEAGADPVELRHEQQRLFLPQAAAESTAPLASIPLAAFERDRTRRFGQSNPELMSVPFWSAMVRAGVSGYEAATHLGAQATDRERPVWCAQRFGQSMTLLSDGRIVQVAGEHEDGYDADFCIYNDVFVHHPDGRLEIFAYPSDVFPPTDFHTATLLGSRIILIGSMGYDGERDYGTTPVFELLLDSWKIRRLTIAGEGPGWIHNHRATPRGRDQIAISGGKVLAWDGEKERLLSNESMHVLDLRRMCWLSGDGA